MNTRTVFFVSDGTGITAETLGHTLLTQFSHVSIRQQRLPFVDTPEKAQRAQERINAAAERDGKPPIVFNTVVKEDVTEILRQSDAGFIDLFGPFLSRLEELLETSSKPKVGRAHGMNDFAAYEERIDATNYALAHDDGVKPSYEDADVILIGVSRSGKTPTCLYLALHYRIKAANYPLTEEDLASEGLPRHLKGYKRKLFGLTIDPERLCQIRQIRRPESKYASVGQCDWEVRAAESLFRLEDIPSLNTTRTSIEEIASKVMVALDLRREMA